MDDRAESKPLLVECMWRTSHQSVFREWLEDRSIYSRAEQADRRISSAPCSGVIERAGGVHPEQPVYIVANKCLGGAGPPIIAAAMPAKLLQRYSPRAREGLKFAAAVTWRDIKRGIKPSAFTLRRNRT
jgi:hypothetical protein